MPTFWLQGVVWDGRVVLDAPLDLPNGTVVTVTEYDPDDDPRPSEPEVQLTGEMLAELVAVWRKEKTWEEAEKCLQQLQAHP